MPGTKFIWPATGVASKDVSYLSPEKEALFIKYLNLYNEKMLSTGDYRGDLYDIGYDSPETHCIQKDKNTYYAFYNPAYTGTVQLRGLDANGIPYLLSSRCDAPFIPSTSIEPSYFNRGLPPPSPKRSRPDTTPVQY